MEETHQWEGKNGADPLVTRAVSLGCGGRLLKGERIGSMEERRDYCTSGGTMYMGGLSYTSRSDHSSRAVRLSSLQGKTGIERNWMNGREERVTHLRDC